MTKQKLDTEKPSIEETFEINQQVLLTQTLRFNSLLNGIVVGMISGFLLLLATLWLVIKGGNIVGPHLALLGQFFIGYHISISGAFIGFAYGFLFGFIFAYSTSSLYNVFVKQLQKRHKNKI